MNETTAMMTGAYGKTLTPDAPLTLSNSVCDLGSLTLEVSAKLQRLEEFLFGPVTPMGGKPVEVTASVDNAVRETRNLQAQNAEQLARILAMLGA